VVDNIAVRIALEGAADVQAKLKQLGLEGDIALKRLQQAAGGLAPALDGAGQSVNRFGTQVSGTGGIVEGLKNAFAAARPAIQQYGASVGGLGAISASTRAGIVGLTAAIAGGLAVALAKSADEAAKARQNLANAFNNQKAGDNAFEGLKKSAQSLGVDVNKLVEGFGNLSSAASKLPPNIIKPPGAAANVEEINKILSAYENLFRLIRSGVGDNDAAAKSAADFLKGFKDGGADAAKLFEDLKGQSKVAADTIAKSLGRGFKDADDAIKSFRAGVGQSLSTDELVRALNKAGEAAKDADAKSRTFSTAIENLGSKLANFGGGGGDRMERIGKAITGAVDSISGAVERADQAFQAFLSNNAGTFETIGNAASRVADVLGQGFQTAISIATQALEGLSSAFEQVRAAPGAFVDHVTQIFQSLVQDLTSVGQSISSAFSTAFQQAQDAVTTAIDAIKQTVQALVSDLQSIGDSIASALTSGFETARDAILSIINSIKAAWKSVTDAVGGSGLDGSEPSLNDSGGFAQGGLIRGPGTGTSDSILASVGRRLIRVSNGEFVIRDAARRYYGADLLQAINQMKLPRNLLRGFNMGGLVTGMEHALASLPGFADGGEVQLAGGGGMHPVILQLPGGEQVGGLSVKHSVLDQLIRELRLKALTQSGGEPWRGR
jgi:hypothetical protein